jgi:DNA-binding YbaB/EbfC family protein
MSNDKLNPQLFKQAQSMQRNLLKLREEMKERIVEGAAGGGLVTAFTNGNGELVKISLKPEAVDPADVAMLEDLIVAAVAKAQEASQTLQQLEMSKVTGGMSLPGLF